MSMIEDAFEGGAELAEEAATLLVGPAAELAADVALLGAEAVVEGVEAASDLVEEIVDEGGSILVKLLVLAGLVAIAVFVWKRMNAAEQPESPETPLPA